MEVLFCVRLAWGLLACLLVLTLADVPQRFIRVQFLSSLGLLAVAGFFLRDELDVRLGVALASSLLFCFAGSVVWHTEAAPLGRFFAWAGVASLTLLLLFVGESRGIHAADDFASAGLLGAATSAMLMGHSYLIAPSMSMTPLYRLLAALGVSLVVRTALALAGVWLWTSQPRTSNLEADLLLWLGVRWLLGIVLPMGLGWMAWETARIRSTQSATGILYVLVIVVFLGELTSLLLNSWTGIVL